MTLWAAKERSNGGRAGFNGSVFDHTLRGCLVCFEGIDGSGKSTVAQSVRDQLRMSGLPSVLIDRKYVDGCPELVRSRLLAISEMVWDYPDNVQVGFLGDRHLIHLLVSWFHLSNDCLLGR